MTRTTSPTRYPIILAHGFNASATSAWGFNPTIAEKLREVGHVVFTTEVSPFTSVAKRAQQLKGQLEKIITTTQAPKLNIIAHSMGGLDARYLITHLGFEDKVASLTTLSTPHRGTFIADFLLAASTPFPEVADQFAKLISKRYTSDDLANNVDFKHAVKDLSEKHAAEFNRKNPDNDQVYYQSWAGISNVAGIQGPHDDKVCCPKNKRTPYIGDAPDHMDPILIPIASFVAHGPELRSNDGVVSRRKCKMGYLSGLYPSGPL